MARRKREPMSEGKKNVTAIYSEHIFSKEKSSKFDFEDFLQLLHYFIIFLSAKIRQ